jgi:hypothetical protein
VRSSSRPLSGRSRFRHPSTYIGLAVAALHGAAPTGTQNRLDRRQLAAKNSIGGAGHVSQTMKGEQ